MHCLEYPWPLPVPEFSLTGLFCLSFLELERFPLVLGLTGLTLTALSLFF